MSQAKEAIDNSAAQDRIIHIDSVSQEDMDFLGNESEGQTEGNGDVIEFWGTDEEGNTWRVHASPSKTLYLRYRIDASRDLGGDRLHSASEAVDQEWHDTEEEAVAYAEGLADEDDELILTVGEYAIEATSEPTDWDWNALRTGTPRREVEVA